MRLMIDEEFKKICSEIISENKTDAEWKEIESCDMFQSEHYCGGYEEDSFWFSFYDDTSSQEYWFGVQLSDLKKIINGKIKVVDMRIAEK